MDTRTKILNGTASLAGIPLIVITGHFDVLRAEHIRELSAARGRARDARVLIIVTSGAGELLPLPARAELAAALRMVDYVLTAEDRDVDRLVETLRLAVLVRLEPGDQRRLHWLKQHVHRLQG